MIAKDNAKDWLPLVQALADGKTIQYRGARGEWRDYEGRPPSINTLDWTPSDYRIKPEPRLRPWKPEEAPKVLVVRQKAASSPSLSLLVNLKWEHGVSASLSDLMHDYIRIHEDGTESPCGVMEDAP